MPLSNNPEFIKFVTRLERKIDSGEIPFVVINGTRYPITPDQVEKFGLVSGQTINQLTLSILIKDLQSVAFDNMISEILGKKSSDEKSESGVGAQEFKQKFKSEMEEKVAMFEELFKQREFQNIEIEDINQKIFPEAFDKVDWLDLKDDKSFNNIIIGKFVECSGLVVNPLTSSDPEACR